MKLTIIVVNYNTADITADCVRSLLRQKLDLEYEIIVVDNGSTDDSINILKDFEEKHKNIRIVLNKSNFGFAKGVNIGLRLSKGEYKLLLNSDIVVKKDSITKLLNFAEKRNDIGVVGAKLLNPDGSTQPSVINFPSIVNAIRQYWLGIKGAYEKYVPKGELPVEVNCVVGAVFLITPDAFSKVGYFDERYFMYFEDHDYCKRVIKAGLKVYYFPGSEFYHYHGKSGVNLAESADQWRRLIPSSKIFNGLIKYYILYFITLTGQKLFRRSS